MSRAPTKSLCLCRSRLKLSEKLAPNLIKAALGEVEAEKTLRPKKSIESAKSTLMHEAEKHPANMAGRELVLQAIPELTTALKRILRRLRPRITVAR